MLYNIKAQDRPTESHKILAGLWSGMASVLATQLPITIKPHNPRSSITPSLRDAFKTVNIQPTPCADGVTYLEVLGVPEFKRTAEL